MWTRIDEGPSPGSSREDGEGLHTEQDLAVNGSRGCWLQFSAAGWQATGEGELS